MPKSYKTIEQDKEKNQQWCVIDIDGVLNYYPDCWLDFIKEKTNYKFVSLQKAKRNLSYYKYKKLKAIYRTSGYKQYISCRIGAQELLDTLHKKGYKIAIVTARDMELSYEDTVMWLKRHNLVYDKLVFSDKKHGKVFELFPFAKFIVEDNTYIAELFSRFGIKVFLVDNKENKEYETQENITRVQTLDEIIEMV